MSKCVMNILDKANTMEGVEKVAMPAINTSKKNQLPKEKCAEILLKTTVEWIRKNGENAKLKKIVFADSDRKTNAIFQKV